MKKVKLMLLSLSILAVVGGALAFTAKKSGTLYCTADTILVDGVTTCPEFCPTQARLQTQTGSNVCTTTANATGSPCSSSKLCFTTNPNKAIE